MEKIFAPLHNIISRAESRPLRLASIDEDYRLKAGDVVVLRTPKYEYTVKVRSSGSEPDSYLGFVLSVRGRGQSKSAFFAEARAGNPVSFHESNIHVVMPANFNVDSAYQIEKKSRSSKN